MSKNKKYLLLLILTITISLLSLDIGSKLIICPKINFVNITKNRKIKSSRIWYYKNK